MFLRTLIIWTMFMLSVAGCQSATESKGEAPMSIQLSTSAFSEGNPIPLQYTCSGEDISPPLNWKDIPAETKSLALIVDDPDAPMGTWVHWVIYDIPPTLGGLPENVAKTPNVQNIGIQGVNDFRKTGYNGPCPPPGKPHRYYFKLYALDTVLSLKPGITKSELEKAMKGHILAQGQLMGTFKR